MTMMHATTFVQIPRQIIVQKIQAHQYTFLNIATSNEGKVWNEQHTSTFFLQNPLKPWHIFISMSFLAQVVVKCLYMKTASMEVEAFNYLLVMNNYHLLYLCAGEYEDKSKYVWQKYLIIYLKWFNDSHPPWTMTSTQFSRKKMSKMCLRLTGFVWSNQSCINVQFSVSRAVNTARKPYV